MVKRRTMIDLLLIPLVIIGFILWLMWNEPGTWSMANGLPGVPYFMSSTGLSDSDFWAVASSMHT